MQGIIHLNNICKSYYLGKQELQVLKGINIDILKNEYVALMGPSGSGKSTLMNILGCLDTPTSGSYILNGKDVSRMIADVARGVGRAAFAGDGGKAHEHRRDLAGRVTHWAG